MSKSIVGKCLLQQMLHKRGLSQLELSQKTGISTSQISDYIHHRRVMTLQTAKRISHALKCYVDDLYEWHL